MTIGAFRLNGLAKTLGDTGDLFRRHGSFTTLFTSTHTFGYKNAEFIGLGANASGNPSAYLGLVLLGNNGQANLHVRHYRTVTDGSGGTNPSGGHGFGYELDSNDASDDINIATRWSGAGYKTTPTIDALNDHMEVAVLYNDGTDTNKNLKLENVTFQNTDGGFNNFQQGQLQGTITPHADNGVGHAVMATTTSDDGSTDGRVAILSHTNSNSNNDHTQGIYGNMFAGTSTPTELATTTSTLYGHKAKLRMVGLPDGGCDFRGAVMAGGSDPKAHFFSYNGTTRTTSATTAVSKTDDADSVPMLAALSDSKIVYGVYSNATNKLYLKAATQTWGSNCATGSTAVGSEIEIDAHDGANIIHGFTDNTFYVVYFDNSETLKVNIDTYEVDGNTIEQVGNGFSYEAGSGSITRYNDISLVSWQHPSYGKHLDILYGTGSNGIAMLKYVKVD